MKELMIILLAFINANSNFGYNAKEGLPEIKFVPIEEIYSGPAWDDLSVEQRRFLYKNTLCVYSPIRGILCQNSLDVKEYSVEWKGYILHELVHFIQYQRGVDKQVPCTAALEFDAYRIQHAGFYERQ